jgi:DnaJ family protein C protein 27
MSSLYLLFHIVRVHLWDLSGNAEYLDVRNELYANTDAVFLTFDLTNQASFESLDIWLR